MVDTFAPTTSTTPSPTQGPASRDELSSKTIKMNLGPQHPATHGTLRQEIEIDGEYVVKCEPEIGFLHTGFEKLAEHMTFNQFVTVTDRMNYFSALCKNIGWVMAVEEALDIEVTEKCKWFRTCLMEMARIADHTASVGLQAMGLGAFSVMLWSWLQREKLYEIFEWTTGIRLTNGFARVGGMAQDIPEGFVIRSEKFLEGLPETLRNVEFMLDRNRIWIERTVGVGSMSAEDLLDYGATGPILRASGVEYDVRRADPYLVYDQLDFEVVTRNEGDVFSRYKVRMDEIRESAKIIRQCIEKMPTDGPMNVSSHKAYLPPKGKDASQFREKPTNMEDLIHHFKQVMDSSKMGNHGLANEAGREFYSCTEAPNGELGWHVVLRGDGRPHRVRVRPPSLITYQAFPKMVEGGLISDLVANLSSLNVIAGELDR